MALDTNPDIIAYDAPKKDLYEIGEMPPLGHVPAKMYAWSIRRERHGEPDTAMQVEVVDTWKLDSHEVLVLVMAAISLSSIGRVSREERICSRTGFARAFRYSDISTRYSGSRLP